MDNLAKMIESMIEEEDNERAQYVLNRISNAMIQARADYDQVCYELASGQKKASEVLPCPFCGGEPKVSYDFIYCPDCGAKIDYSCDDQVIEGVSSAWNRRASEPDDKEDVWDAFKSFVDLQTKHEILSIKTATNEESINKALLAISDINKKLNSLDRITTDAMAGLFKNVDALEKRFNEKEKP